MRDVIFLKLWDTKNKFYDDLYNNIYIHIMLLTQMQSQSHLKGYFGVVFNRSRGGHARWLSSTFA